VTYAVLGGAGVKDEARLHKHFAAYRLNGEWFRKEGEVAEWIEAGCPHD
jgi:hypothetical protein